MTVSAAKEKMIRADLHIHTYYSDGLQSPKDVVDAAAGRGVNLIAVTDHDNAVGRKEVADLAASAGIRAVGGTEISAYEGDLKLHTLGYNLDFNHPAYVKFYNACLEASKERAEDSLSKLRKVGVNITIDEVLSERRSPLSPVHTMLIAYAGIKKGYATDHYDFYARYLAYGSAGFSNIGRPSPESAVEVIKECGGVASLAHPGRIDADDNTVINVIERLKNCGLDGIEAVYSGHTARETQYFKGIAAKYGLLVTGGSDTHFKDGNHMIGTPPFYPSEELLAALKLI